MPANLDRCVDDVKKQGKSNDSAWGICKSSTGHTKEAVNKNRQVPFFDPKITKGKVEPKNVKSTKGMGGERINKDSFLWKEIFDSQIKRDAK